MFNGFPIPKPDGVASPWIHDWSAYQPVYDITGNIAPANANSWLTFVDVVGKGFLKWCRVNSRLAAQANPSMKITVDGKEYTFDSPLAGSGYQGNEVNYEIPFKSSLKIEAYNRGAADYLFCDYLYLLQQSSPNANNVTLLQQSQRKMAYYSAATTTLADVVNVAGSGYLLGIKFNGYYVTAASNITGDIIIDGIQKMNNRTLFGIGTEIYKQSDVIGPIRFNSSLRIRIKSEAAGSNPVCEVWYSLD